MAHILRFIEPIVDGILKPAFDISSYGHHIHEYGWMLEHVASITVYSEFREQLDSYFESSDQSMDRFISVVFRSKFIGPWNMPSDKSIMASLIRDVTLRWKADPDNAGKITGQRVQACGHAGVQAFGHAGVQACGHAGTTSVSKASASRAAASKFSRAARKADEDESEDELTIVKRAKCEKKIGSLLSR